MNFGTTVFSQLMEFLPSYEFRLCVDRYHGNFKVKNFSCWDQFLCLAFAQITYRESLRDIETCLRAVGGKLYHMGIRGKVSRNTLAHANEVRDWRIYRDFAQVLIRNARELYFNEPLAVQLDQTTYALDSTVIGSYHRPIVSGRWQVGLFFKWIKQHLRIKAFYGTSENAVKTQIWIAISVYVLVAIVKKRLNLQNSLYSILQILSVTILEKTPILQVLLNIDESENMLDDAKQLILFN